MKIPSPKFNDTQIRTILNQAITSQAVLVAHEIGLFEAIGNEKFKAEEISQLLSLPARSAISLLSTCVYYKLIMLKLGYYKLSEYAKEYLLKASPFYFGEVLDLLIQQNAVRSFSSIKNSIITGKPAIYNHGDLFEAHEANLDLAKNFTKAMHAKSIGPASAWPNLLNLKNYSTFLDIGGGAGTHTISACIKWPHIKGILYEKPVVGEMAKQYILKYQLDHRISVQFGDMWTDDFPPSEVHFYSDIYHDWPEDKVCQLSKKSFDSLPANGVIILHEMLFNRNEKIEPYNVLAYNLNMLLWTQGQQFSGEELKAMLLTVGFIKIKIYRTFGDWHIIVGYKP